jgi:hypothetical protein
MKFPQPSAADGLRWSVLSERVVLWSGLGLFAALAIFGMTQEGSTFDECAHLPAGYTYLVTGDYRLNPEHPPLAKLLAALPLRVLPKLGFSTAWPEWQAGDQWGVGRRFLYIDNDADQLLFWGRLPIVLLTCLLGWFIHRWSREVLGPTGAALALLMFALTPDFLAHGALVTTDAPIATFLFMSCYFSWRCLTRLTLIDLLASGLTFGAALATKFSALLLVPVFVGMLLVRAISARTLVVQPMPWARPRELTTRWQRSLVLAAACAVAGLTAIVVVWSAYGFHAAASVIPVAHPAAASVSAAPVTLAQKLGLLPEAYLTGLLDAIGQSQARPSFLLGRRANFGFSYYFVISFLVKTPLPMLVLILAGSILAVARAWSGARVYLALLVPPLAYGAAALVAHLNIGHRHLLPIYPFLIMLAAGAAATLLQHTWTRWVALGLYAWLAIGTWSIAPSYLAYFNELGGGPRGGMQILVDSNLDWGQDLPGLKRWMSAQGVRRIYLSYFGTGVPEYYGIDYAALPSFAPLARPLVHTLDLNVSRYIAVSATNLQKVYMPAVEAPRAFEDFLDHLREHREPSAVIGGSIYVYELKQR